MLTAEAFRLSSIISFSPRFCGLLIVGSQVRALVRPHNILKDVSGRNRLRGPNYNGFSAVFLCAGQGIRFLHSDRRRSAGLGTTASLWLAHSRKIFSSPLVSGNIQTAADVRCRARAPSAVRIDVARRTINSCPAELSANRRAA